MRKVFVLVLVSLIVMLTMPLIFTNVALANATDAGYITITAEEAKPMIDENQSIVILDVGTSTEYKLGHIEGAKLIPLLELEERINAIDGNSAVIVYCRTGVKSENASKILLDHGFDKVYNMMGGLNAWQDAGFPVVSSSTANQITPSNDSLSSEIEDILNSGKSVFLFLYVDWCHFCQQQMPIIDELEQEYAENITFFHVDCEEHTEAVREFGVNGYPAMFLIMGKGDDRQYESQYFRGFTDEETLKRSIEWIIANGSINENSKDNELGIGASPMVLIDNEDYTVALAGAASRPSSPPGVAAYEQQSVFTCGPGSNSYAMSCTYDLDCPSASSGLPGSGDHCVTDGNECIINARWSCVNSGKICFVDWYMKEDCGERDVWKCTPEERAWHYKNYCKPEAGPACAIMTLDNIPCNDNDGWVCISTTTREYRDYYCTADIPGSPLCSYPTPTQTESCDDKDGWYPDGANAEEYRDYRCSDGDCVYDVTDHRCNDGFGNCDGNWSNGCEVNTNTDRNNCGSCGNACPADYPCCLGNDLADCTYSCVDGSCFLSKTATGTCPVGQHCEGGECKDDVPEFPAGVTAVFGATLFIFLMMRRKYIRK